MKTIYVLIFVFINISHSAFCQFEMPREYAWSALLLDFNKGEDFGTGIFYADTANLYIVTAKHVIQKYINSDDEMIVTLYAKDDTKQDSVNKESIKISLKSLYVNGLIKTHSKKDIAIIKVGEIRDSLLYYYNRLLWFNKSTSSQPLIFRANNVAYFKDVRTTREVFVFGYPKTIGLEKQPQYDFNSPLIQKGIIAAKDYERKSFILNCPVYGGNSGGPVVQIRGVIETNIRLIGLVTDYIPYINKENNIEFNSGYSVVTPIEDALELMRLK